MASESQMVFSGSMFLPNAGTYDTIQHYPEDTYFCK